MGDFDPAMALRMLANNRLRNAQGWCEYRDLGGALAVTSDAPIAALNCVGDFATTERRLEGLLDVGFSLLRAFDRPPAVELSPLDRPESIADALRRRGLDQTERRSWMIFRGDSTERRPPRDLEIRIAEPDDALTFANLHGGTETWVRRLSRSSTLTAMLDGGNTFYMGCIDGQPVATLHLLVDGDTAGIYAVGTMRTYRKRGIASELTRRAIADAAAAGAHVICLSTLADGDAERLYATLGFQRSFVSELWVEPDRPAPEPVKKAKRVRVRPATG
jgi:ribosomal protein S18 acetylase RimI-like enzyme